MVHSSKSPSPIDEEPHSNQGRAMRFTHGGASEAGTCPDPEVARGYLKWFSKRQRRKENFPILGDGARSLPCSWPDGYQYWLAF